MKAMVAVILMVSGSGCARALVQDHMQPDHSYRIEIDGNYYATSKAVHNAAHVRADHLCPKGYETSAEFSEDLEHANHVLIVACKK